MAIADKLTTEVVQLERGVLVTPVGSASMDLCDRLQASLEKACQMRPRVLVIDLSRLDFICSLGLGGIVVAFLRMHKSDGRLALARPSPAIREILATTRLGTLMPIYDSVEEALAGR